MEPQAGRADPARVALAGGEEAPEREGVFQPERATSQVGGARAGSQLDLSDWERIKAERLPTGEWRFFLALGDPRKATSKLWAKKVKAVDTSKANGYAFELSIPLMGFVRYKIVRNPRNKKWAVISISKRRRPPARIEKLFDTRAEAERWVRKHRR